MRHETRGRQLNPPCACSYQHTGPECNICVCGRRHSVTCDRDGCRFECHADAATDLLGLGGHRPVTECDKVRHDA